MKICFFSMFNPNWWYLLIAMKTKGSVRFSTADILLHRYLMNGIFDYKGISNLSVACN